VKTEKHDLIHLWMHEEDNLRGFTTEMLKDITVNDLKEKKDVHTVEHAVSQYREFYDYKAIGIQRWKRPEKRVEVPISKSKAISHTNVVDCIIDVNAVCATEFKPTNKTNYDYKQVGLEYPVQILCEYKPELPSFSAVIGQIHVYSKILSRADTLIIPVIITFDQNRDYDKLLNDDGIRVFRLTYDGHRKRATYDFPETPPTEKLSDLEDLFWSDKAKATAK
jgi:hypothetical protein